MSAPTEVWVPFFTDGRMMDIVEEHNECGDAVRYIRADSCPFCGEVDFDLVGLKIHFEHGYCATYNSTELPKVKP